MEIWIAVASPALPLLQSQCADVLLAAKGNLPLGAHSVTIVGHSVATAAALRKGAGALGLLRQARATLLWPLRLPVSVTARYTSRIGMVKGTAFPEKACRQISAYRLIIIEYKT